VVFFVAQNSGFPRFDEVTRHVESVVLEIARHGMLRATAGWTTFGLRVCSVIDGGNRRETERGNPWPTRNLGSSVSRLDERDTHPRRLRSVSAVGVSVSA
jgi:hypothetical protein